MILRRAAEAALSPCLPPGWRVEQVRRRSVDTVEVVLRSDDPEAPGVALEWSQPDDPPSARAFAKGPRYTASYRRGPALWDIDAAETSPEIRELAYAAARTLAGLGSGPELRPGGLDAAEREPPPTDDIEALAAAVREAVTRDLGTEELQNPEGWELTEVRVFQRWAPVVEVLLRRPDRTLAFIITPRDMERPAFQRTAHLDLVYYSDDLPVEAHDRLYTRDREAIEGFATWLRLVFDPPSSHADERFLDEAGRFFDEGCAGHEGTGGT